MFTAFSPATMLIYTVVPRITLSKSYMQSLIVSMTDNTILLQIKYSTTCPNNDLIISTGLITDIVILYGGFISAMYPSHFHLIHISKVC